MSFHSLNLSDLKMTEKTVKMSIFTLIISTFLPFMYSFEMMFQITQFSFCVVTIVTNISLTPILSAQGDLRPDLVI